MLALKILAIIFLGLNCFAYVYGTHKTIRSLNLFTIVFLSIALVRLP